MAFVLAAALCVGLAGCSSVTRLPVSASGSLGAAGVGLNAGGDAGSAAAAGSDVPGEAAITGGTAAGAATSRTATGRAAGTSSSGSVATSGARACSKPVLIGASYSSDLATGLAAVGNPGAASTAAQYAANVQKSYQLGVDDLNKRGGVGGCPVQLDFFDFKSLGADGFDGQSQQECTHFAEDAKVALVYAAALESRVLIDCLREHRVPVIFNGAEYWPAQDDFAKNRSYLYRPSGLVIDRWGPFIDAYDSVGYFDKGAKVGILLDDDGSGHNQHLVNDIWKPKLAARGITPTVFTFQAIKGYSDVSRVTSQFASAVLQFKSQGITHVMTTPDASAVAIFFTQEAQSQDYHPRYALTTPSGAGTWSTVPDGQKPRAVAVSQVVSDFLDDGVRAQLPNNPNRAHCEALYRPQNLLVDYGWCAALDMLHAALGSSQALTVSSLLAGVEGLGASLVSAHGYGGTRFGPNHYDGLAAARAFTWDDAKNEWKLGPPAVSIP